MVVKVLYLFREIKRTVNRVLPFFFIVCIRFFLLSRTTIIRFNFWFQVLFIQRLAVCNPYGAILLKMSLLNNLVRPDFQNYFVPLVSCLALFFQFYIFHQEGFLFLAHCILALVVQLCFRHSYLRYFFCFLFLGFSIKEEHSKRRCNKSFPVLYSFWIDILYYFGIMFLLGRSNHLIQFRRNNKTS